MTKNIIITIWTFLGGRKFLAWTTACVFLCFGLITSNQWFWITVAYFGVNFLRAMAPSIVKKEG